jgi:hypothetical protein
MTIKQAKENKLFTDSIIAHGNGKLLDYDNEETGERIRYAQYNLPAVKTCPFRSAGCEIVCYATKGNHCFPSVVESREKAFEVSKRDDFSAVIVHTVETLQMTKRYKGNVMQLRLHESGDFYNLAYLRKWVKAWETLAENDGIRIVFYTKSFKYFLELSDEEKRIINRMMASGKLAMNLSVDDTTTKEQMIRYLEMLTVHPLANTYRVTEKTTEKDDVCDCANCGKCGACNKATGGHKVVRIHSASNAEKEEYNRNKRSGK